jgi:hypothetical protein
MDTTTTDTQLAELRAKRAALADAREARAILTPDQEIEKEKRALEQDDALDKAETEHGAKRVRLVRGDSGAVILKRPHMVTFRKFQDRGTTDSEALEALIKPCILWPTKAEFDALMQEEPALLQRCANAVCALAGVRVDEVTKK